MSRSMITMLRRAMVVLAVRVEERNKPRHEDLRTAQFARLKLKTRQAERHEQNMNSGESCWHKPGCLRGTYVASIMVDCGLCIADRRKRDLHSGIVRGCRTKLTEGILRMAELERGKR